MQVKIDLVKMNHLVTGEKLSTKLAVKNIGVVQDARLLSSLNAPDNTDRFNHQKLDEWIKKQCFTRFCGAGECRHSSMAYLRYLGTFGDDVSKARVDKFVRKLSEYRDGGGRWKGFPFYYTLLVLSELTNQDARTELQYAVPACQRAMKRIGRKDPFAKIRQEILSNVLNLGATSGVLDLLLMDNQII
ncbi:MAG: hypothetical protein P1Q69_00240 [Candidatus Thorarchaeota archaeon]|nr:hypothetical protein [Candidatus Thorarchaeota archaeon]